MSYYEFLLPNTNTGLKMLKRAFLILACFNFATGLIGMIIALVIHWVFVFLPLVWFLLGFVYGNVAYIFVTDYKYVFDNGTFSIYKLRKFGRYRLVVSIPCAELESVDERDVQKVKPCTNSPETDRLVYQGVMYIVTIDEYMQWLIKGASYVS